MIYFVNEYLVALNSGIEHAEMKRLKMFRDADIPAQIVTRNYDRLETQNKARFDLPADATLNMFDYFQEATDVKPVGKNEPKIETLKLAADYNVDPGADVSHVYDGDQLVMDVRFTPGTVGQLYTVDSYDRWGKHVSSDLYDFRGFKSRTQFFSDAGELISQISYNPQGKRKLEEYFAHNQDGQNYCSLIKLIDYHGQDSYYNSYDELFTFFLDELNTQAGGNAVFVADRPGSIYDDVLNMQTSARRFITVPTTHTVDPQDQVYANLSPIYAHPFVDQVTRLEGIITASSEQRADIIRWMGGPERLATKLETASFAIVPDKQLQGHQPTLDERTAEKLIFVGRLTKNQRLNLLVDAFAKLHSHRPDATLDIYGYGDVATDLQKQIDEAKLKDFITLKGYLPDLNEAYDHAQVFVSATESDSQPLSMVEALSHGLPVVAFDTHYGPAQLIENEVNGYLVPNGDVDGLARSLELTLQDHARWRKFSRAAVEKAKPYAASQVMKQWRQIFQK